MIFKPEHIEMMRAGTKTQTRRESSRYEIGKTYAIQPRRGEKGLPDVRILITRCVVEFSSFNRKISEEDAIAEGGYTVKEYEELYKELYPSWSVRHAYTFKVVRIPQTEQKVLSGVAK